jgi:redox-sensitive bicupin YhaK (pirin superfamily)
MHRAPQDYPTDPLYLDLHFPATGATFNQTLPAAHNAFIYVYRGTVHIVDDESTATPVPLHRMAILHNEGTSVRLQADEGSEPARALLIAGKPLREPIAQYGPFVMNTREELVTAVDDFNQGRMG